MEIQTSQNHDPNWKPLRRGIDFLRIPATDAVTICGLDKYKSCRSLWEYIHGLRTGKYQLSDESDEGVVNFNHQIGHHCENLMKTIYCSTTGNRVETGNMWLHPNYSNQYGASLDGKVFLFDNKSNNSTNNNNNNADANDSKINLPDGILECKTVLSNNFSNLPLAGHLCQMQYQMFVTGLPWCDYIAWHMPDVLDSVKKGTLNVQDISPNHAKTQVIFRVYKNARYINWIKNQVDLFVECQKGGMSFEEYDAKRRVRLQRIYMLPPKSQLQNLIGLYYPNEEEGDKADSECCTEGSFCLAWEYNKLPKNNAPLYLNESVGYPDGISLQPVISI